MNRLAPADQVWNRACYGGGAAPGPGDRALAALLAFHGPAMNGGVLHACEFLDAQKLEAAEAGYRFFGFDEIADIILRAQRILKTEDDLEENDERLNIEYASFVPLDAHLANRFEAYFLENPDDFAPL